MSTEPEKDSYKKPVTVVTPPELIVTKSSQVKFNKKRFDDAIFDKGRVVFIEKALRCSCFNAVTNNGLPDCDNCGGSGWIFIDKKKTTVILQALNRQSKYTKWTEENRGTINITARGVDRLAFMDRITIIDETSIFNQEQLKFKVYNGKLSAFSIYYPLEITEVYLFVDSEIPLRPLIQGIDYSVEHNLVTLIGKEFIQYKDKSKISVTMRYYYHPQYHVIDIPREVVVQKGLNCEEDEVQRDMPINAVGRPAHLILDAPNKLGEGLYDNSAEPVIINNSGIQTSPYVQNGGFNSNNQLYFQVNMGGGNDTLSSSPVIEVAG